MTRRVAIACFGPPTPTLLNPWQSRPTTPKQVMTPRHSPPTNSRKHFTGFTGSAPGRVRTWFWIAVRRPTRRSRYLTRPRYSRSVFDGMGIVGNSPRAALRQLQGVVAVGLAFDLAPAPRLVHRVGDEAPEVEFAAEVRDPSGDGAGLEDDEIGPDLLKLGAERQGIRGDGAIGGLLGLGLINADHTLELPTVEPENRVHGRVAPWGPVRST